MLELIILILDVMEIDPDNNVSPLVRELAERMRRLPVWDRKTEWKRLRLALKHRYVNRISTQQLLDRIRVHGLELDEKLKDAV